ncbi:MAG: trans-2-enoyl-CoA reductase family protein [Synergistaceae bacterium]|nr:trans-2-enoyl-CoA reductase family protein [Synergistaceae bacterium]
MIIKPKYRGFICTTVHPVGCRKNVEEQIEYVKSKGKIAGPGRVLVVGSSTGYGLASRISAAYGFGAKTVGVFFEKPGTEQKTGSAGWYNNEAFEARAKKDGLDCVSVNGDAFSKDAKAQAIEAIKRLMPDGKVDLVVYSIAAPKRTDHETGQVYNSVIKPVGGAFTGKTVDFHTGNVSEISVAPASADEIDDTVAVMGGGDWKLWMEALNGAGALADGAASIAFSYIGPTVTHAIYKDGTIGHGKADLEKKSKEINDMLKGVGGKSYISINKAVVTQASAAIPVVSLYVSILFKVMKEKNLNENCIEQMYRLFSEKLYNGSKAVTDEAGRLRVDDLEMREDVQSEVMKLWDEADSGNIYELSDLKGFRKEFFRLFGFERDDIDYEADVNLEEVLRWKV